jgi:hypothetical protein
MKVNFKVTAKCTVRPYITEGKTYTVFALKSDRLDRSAAMFYIWTDNECFTYITDGYFRLAED